MGYLVGPYGRDGCRQRSYEERSFLHKQAQNRAGQVCIVTPVSAQGPIVEEEQHERNGRQ